MPIARLAVVLCTSLVLGTTGLSADEVVQLQGARVRVRTRGERVFIGTFAGADGESIAIDEGNRSAVRHVDRSDVAALEVSRGCRRRTLEGLLAGAGAWAAIVGVFAAFDTLDESGLGEPLFICGMVAAGGVVGTLKRTERWELVPDRAVSLRLLPRRRGVQAQVVVAF
jgi:hypothetical protein